MVGGRVNILTVSACVSTVLFFELFQGACAKRYTVGGSNEWAYPPNNDLAWYDNDWTTNLTFRVGDVLVFKYPVGAHNVYTLANEADYTACNLAPTKTYATGNDLFTLSAQGTYYYVCGIPGHCQFGMKVKISVPSIPATTPVIAPPVPTPTSPLRPPSPTPTSPLRPPLPTPTSPLRPPSPSHSSLVPALVATFVTVTVVILLVGGWIALRRSYGRKGTQSARVKQPLPNFDGSLDGPKRFSYKDLSVATKGFSAEQLLGRGGFGSVYKGVLRDTSTVVAVKRIAEDSEQGEIEYLAEVTTIGRIRHRNLVRLQGWCHERGKLLVVYDYMPNGSLEKYLIKPAVDLNNESPVLAWDTRYKILTGVAAALAYLHEEWEQCILHRDVKPSNVLLDSHFNPYLADFGLARLIDHDKLSQTTVVAGTVGYLAPELPHTGKPTTKSDVYSFGVLALEVACGRRPFEMDRPDGETSLLDWVWSMHQGNQLCATVDARLRDAFDEVEFSRVVSIGLLCCLADPHARPTMRYVRQVLTGDVSLPTLPPSKPVVSYSWAPEVQLTLSSSFSTEISSLLDQKTNSIQ